MLKDNLSYGSKQVGARFETPSYGSSRSRPQANIESESEMTGTYEVIDHAQ